MKKETIQQFLREALKKREGEKVAVLRLLLPRPIYCIVD